MDLRIIGQLKPPPNEKAVELVVTDEVKDGLTKVVCPACGFLMWLNLNVFASTNYCQANIDGKHEL